MSVTEGEAGPGGGEAEPLDLIAAFLDANDNLAKVAIYTCKQPSAEAMAILNHLKGRVVESAAPMVVTKFFRDTGDVELINTAVGAVIGATEILWDTATEVRPDDPSHFNFDDDVRKKIVEALTNEDEEDETVRESIASAMGLSNTYEFAVENLFQKVMTAEPVVMYAMGVSEQAERKKQLINFGSVALATFVGTSLAHYFFGRKR